MKKAAIFLIVLVGCSPAKQINGLQLIDGCPKDGDCTIAIEPNKRLSSSIDNFGALEYTLAEDANKSVAHFNYVRKVKGNLQDAGYREELLIELDNAWLKSNSSANAENSKLIFGRFCFCKGQTGYYDVPNAQVTKNGRIVTVQLSPPQVPHIIKELTFEIR